MGLTDSFTKLGTNCKKCCIHSYFKGHEGFNKDVLGQRLVNLVILVFLVDLVKLVNMVIMVDLVFLVNLVKLVIYTSLRGVNKDGEL